MTTRAAFDRMPSRLLSTSLPSAAVPLMASSERCRAAESGGSGELVSRMVQESALLRLLRLLLPCVLQLLGAQLLAESAALTGRLERGLLTVGV